MKKFNLSSLVIIGISAGVLAVSCETQRPVHEPSSRPPGGMEEMNPDMQSFYNSLSPEGKKKFHDLDAQHKMMSIEMTHQACSGKNSCASMGGCKASGHECAGLSGCKGQGGEPVRDPNRAVDVQHRNQMQKVRPSNGSS